MPLATTDQSLGLRKQAISENKEKEEGEQGGGGEERRGGRKLARSLWCESQDIEF